MADTIQITDGTTTIDLLDSSAGYCALDRGWSPKVAQRNTTGIGGKPYLPVQEDITIKVTGATAVIVHQRLNALANLIDQAGRWYDGENVDAVLFQYQPAGSATTYSTTIQRDANALLELPSTFADAELYVGADGVTMTDVTLSFVRDGLWYGEEEAGYVNIIANGDFEANTTGWSGQNSTLAQNTSLSTTGSASLEITATGAGAMWAQTTPLTSVVVTGGQEYKLVVDQRTNTTIRIQPVILWYTAASAFISVSNGTFAASQNVWSEYTITATAPASAAYARVYVCGTESTPSAGAKFYADNVRFYSTTATATSIGNPAVLEMTFDESAAVPSPVDFELSRGATLRQHNVVLAVTNDTDKLKFYEAESMSKSGGTTTAVTTASAGNVYKLNGYGYVYTDTPPVGRAVIAVATVRNLSASITWDVKLLAREATTFAAGTYDAIQSLPVRIPVSSEPDIVLLGPVILRDLVGSVGIDATPSATVTAGNELEIDSVLFVAIDDNTKILTFNAIFNYNSDAVSVPNSFTTIAVNQAVLTEPKPRIFTPLDQIFKDTVAKHLPFFGNGYTFLNGDRLAIAYVSQAVGDYSSLTTDSYTARDGVIFPSVAESESNITLGNVTRRRAYLIPE